MTPIMIKMQTVFDSTCPSHLKDLLIQDSGTKDSNALSVDDSPFASPQRPGHLLLTVHNDGDTLLVHAESNTMPSAQQGSNRDETRCRISNTDPTRSHQIDYREICFLKPTHTQCIVFLFLLPPFIGHMPGFVGLFWFCSFCYHIVFLSRSLLH